MVVQTERGDDYVVLGDRLIGEVGFINLSEYDRWLKLNTHPSLTGYDIMKVFSKGEKGEIKSLQELLDGDKVLIWDRQKEEREAISDHKL
jgi:hypothetical protein